MSNESREICLEHFNFSGVWLSLLQSNFVFAPVQRRPQDVGRPQCVDATLARSPLAGVSKTNFVRERLFKRNTAWVLTFSSVRAATSSLVEDAECGL